MPHSRRNRKKAAAEAYDVAKRKLSTELMTRRWIRATCTNDIWCGTLEWTYSGKLACIDRVSKAFHSEIKRLFCLTKDELAEGEYYVIIYLEGTGLTLGVDLSGLEENSVSMLFDFADDYSFNDGFKLKTEIYKPLTESAAQRVLEIVY